MTTTPTREQLVAIRPPQLGTRKQRNHYRLWCRKYDRDSGLETRVRIMASTMTTLRQATRLWNWIDHQPNPNPLWEIMLYECSWPFTDPLDANSIRFTY